MRGMEDVDEELKDSEAQVGEEGTKKGNKNKTKINLERDVEEEDLKHEQCKGNMNRGENRNQEAKLDKERREIAGEELGGKKGINSTDEESRSEMRNEKAE